MRTRCKTTTLPRQTNPKTSKKRQAKNIVSSTTATEMKEKPVMQPEQEVTTMQLVTTSAVENGISGKMILLQIFANLAVENFFLSNFHKTK